MGIKKQIDAAVAAPGPGLSGSLFDRAKAAATLATARSAKKDLLAASKGPQEQVSFVIQKPIKGKFHRVHPDESYRILNLPVLIDPDDDSEYYLVGEGVEDLLHESVAALIKHIDLYAAQDHTGAQYLWPVRHGSPKWLKAGTKAVNRARKGWVSVSAVITAQTYITHPPVNEIADPDWSLLPAFSEMVESVFEDREIVGPAHEIVRKIMGATPRDKGGDE